MKRVLSLGALVLFAMCILSRGALAQGNPTVSIKDQKATLRSPVDVPVKIDGFDGIGAISLVVTYDPEVVSFPEEADTDDLISGAPRDGFSASIPEPGEIRISWFDTGGAGPITGGDQTLLRLTFDEYKGGSGTVAFEPESEVADPQSNPYNASYRDGEVQNVASLIDVSLRQEFNGTTDPTNYELVALPGRADVPFEETVSGRQGTGWRGLQESGSGTGLQECSVELSCVFRAGKGFWVLSQNDWSFEGTVPEVVTNDPSIPLHGGWNIVSNPLRADVTWQDVQATNGLSEPLWRWTDDGRWEQVSVITPAAEEGEAYYLFNEPGLDSLKIPTVGVGAADMSFPLPVSQAPSEGLREARSGPRPNFHTQRQRSRLRDRSKGDLEASQAGGGLTGEEHASKDSPQPAQPGRSAEQLVRIHAEVDGKRVAAVTVGLNSSLNEPRTYRAPPAYFAETAFHVTGENGTSKFTRRILPTDNPTRSFSLFLRGDPGSDVRLVATGNDGWESRWPVLVEKETGQTRELKPESSVRISLPEDKGKTSFLLRLKEN